MSQMPNLILLTNKEIKCVKKVKCQTHFALMMDIVKPILNICTLFSIKKYKMSIDECGE